jgi:hypothetical protein
LSYFNSAKACKMVGYELAIQQVKPAKLKPCNKPCQRNFRGIGFAREHAFTEKRTSQR